MRLLKKIVDIVLKVIKNVPLVVEKHPVSLEEIVKDFEVKTLQSVESDQGVQILGIWGMGGSGKTTLAEELYNKKSSLMKWSSFVFDVRDVAIKGFLYEKLKKILKDLGFQDVVFDNIEEDALLPAKDNLERGSLIIVTIREYDVLKFLGITSIYKMKALDPFHAEKLFCWHAFIQPFPRDGFEKLVKEFLEACCGLPLSLKVFGAQLYGEFRKECWEYLLHKTKRMLSNDIKEKLRLSYDVLDDEEKEAFLDIACFFIGERNTLVIEVWNGSGWCGLYSWERLLNKCLVELDNYNRIMMHDHLRDLGREIAEQHSPYRIWLF
ncbi:hypothetical protein SUGI_0675250 [Cryptomeria japonica]|nr:hypothetical protein SUGI_0675250 [Cryptomeria japonica]